MLKLSLTLSLFLLIPINSVYGAVISTDRIVDWQPGIQGGIPARTTIGADVTDFGAAGDGVADDTNAIRSAINSCPENQVVFLPEGTYRITGTLSINKSIVLRGEGPDTTKIMLDSSSSSIVNFGSFSTSTPVNMVGSYSKDASSVTVENAGAFNVGDYVLITQTDDPSLISLNGGTWWKRSGRSMGQVNRITAKASATLTLERPLYYPFSASFDPEIEVLPNVLEYAGIEDMLLYRNVPHGGQGEIILMQNSANCWAKNVETFKVSGRHISLVQSYRIVIRDSYIHHAFEYNSGANAYGISLNYYTSDSLVENNIVYYLNAGILLENTGGGNVIAYNYGAETFVGESSSWFSGELNTHLAHNYMDLFEGNMVSKPTIDYIHGSSSHLTFLRNSMDMSHDEHPPTNNINGIELAAWSRYINVVGNVIGTPSFTGDYEKYQTSDCNSTAIYKLFSDGGSCAGWDTVAYATLLRHGNFDYFHDSVVWDDSIPDHVIPRSYYLSGRPAFWDDQGPGRLWPSIGPDVSGYVIDIPAKDRFEAEFSSGEIDQVSPSHPTSLMSINPDPI